MQQALYYKQAKRSPADFQAASSPGTRSCCKGMAQHLQAFSEAEEDEEVCGRGHHRKKDDQHRADGQIDLVGGGQLASERPHSAHPQPGLGLDSKWGCEGLGSKSCKAATCCLPA